MGMEEVFSRDADLSGMTGERNLFVSEVVHKAFIEVTEAGTEAAAATAGIVALKSALREKPVRFQADHPFLYLLIDEVSGCIIFSGRLVRPSENV
jgi:serpin B